MGDGTSRPDTRFLVDVHVHAGAPPGAEAMAEQINSPKDWALQRSKQPEHFAEVLSQKQIDNSDLLVEKMDEKGVTHAIIQMMRGTSESPIWPDDTPDDCFLSTAPNFSWLPSVQVI